MNLKERAEKLKTDIPAVFLSLKDKETPWYAKAMAFLTVGYALSPIDLIPDFIPVIGYLDDIILLPAMIALTIKFIPEKVWNKNQILAENLWKEKSHAGWYFAIPVIIIWTLIILTVLKTVFF